MNLDLKRITSKYITDRKAKLMAEAGTRDRKIEKYVRMYHLDVYEGPQLPGEYRVSLPVAFDLVEKSRALLITRPPIFVVPSGGASPEAQAKAQRIERYLDGAAYRMNFHKALNGAGFWAVCAGFGMMRLTYDPMAADDEFPLRLLVPDPRSCFWTLDSSGDRFTEFVHTWKRSRAEVRDEWGVKFSQPDGLSLEAETAFWDEKVNYVEYWLETIDWETVVEEPAEDKPLLTDLVAKAFSAGTLAPAGVTPAEVEGALNGGEDYAGEAEDKEPPKPKKQKRRVRKIVHSVVIEDAGAADADSYGAMVVKKPVVMPYYQRIPFFVLTGIETPLQGASSFISPLFPLTNGDSGDKSIGVAQLLNLLTSVDTETAVTSPNSPLFTDSQTLKPDNSPGAINVVEPGAKVWRAESDSTNPAVGRMMEVLSGQIARVGIPDVFSGQMQHLSGQAISGFATVFQMLVGHRQQSWERALSSLMEMALCLTKHYAAGRGEWRVWGTSPTGRPIDVTISPEDIGDIYRVQTKLSTSMPKDSSAQVSLLSMLQQKNQISMETFLNLLQQLPDFGLNAESPDDEMQRIIRDGVLKHPDFMRFMAAALGQQFMPFMLGSENVSPDQIAQALALMYPPQMQGGPGGPGGAPGLQPSNTPGQMPGPGVAQAIGLRGPGGVPGGAMPGVPGPAGPQLSGPMQSAMPGGGGAPPAPNPLQAYEGQG